MALLVIAAMVLTAFLTLTMAFFYAKHKVFPGFRRWTVGCGFIAFGYLMMVLRGVIPQAVSIFMVNIAIPMAAVLYLDGMRRFLGLSDISRNWYAIPAISAILSTSSYYFFDSNEWRSLIISLSFSIPHMLTSVLVFKDYPKTKSFFHLIIGTEMFLACLILMARSAWGFTISEFQLMMSSPIESAFFIILMVLQIVITVSFIMMNTERFERDLLEAESALKANVHKLSKALTEVKTLRGLLPICASCKKIRDDQGQWVQMEVYVRDRTEADFSHGICPDCLKTLYPEFYGDK